MCTDTKPIIQAVLSGNAVFVDKCLSEGASPNEVWGELPLLVHAALLPSLPVFKMLIERGATVPDEFLLQVIDWELGDWRIDSEETEEQFVQILKLVRPTKAWLSAEKRRELIAKIQTYNLPNVVSTLLTE